VGVVPVYPRHPVALAHQAATVQALIGGRLTLGVGVSHRPAMEGMHGIPYVKPASYMREYLSVLRPLLQDGRATFHGEFFDVAAEFAIPGTVPVSILVGALSPNMVRVAGELADGVVTWLAGARTLAGQIVPGVRAAAAGAGHRDPRVVAALPVALCDDEAAGREAAGAVFARYGTLPNYQRQFEREGVGSAAELALVGDERAIEAGLRGLAAAGVTDFWPVAFGVGEGAGASVDRTRKLMAALGPNLRLSAAR
jgi:F420-dependent oxidoreductase-like protein